MVPISPGRDINLNSLSNSSLRTTPIFLSIDGIDGVGKSTQCSLLANWLRQHEIPVAICRDPGDTALGNELRRLLLHRQDVQIAPIAEALLFVAARAQLVTEVIQPALKCGQNVLSDRFTLANVVYQGYAGGLDPDDIWHISRWACGNVEPDLTLILDLDDVEIALRRKQATQFADRLEQKDVDFYRRVRDGYRREAQRWPERFILIPADADIDTLHTRLRQLLTPLLRERGWKL